MILLHCGDSDRLLAKNRYRMGFMYTRAIVVWTLMMAALVTLLLSAPNAFASCVGSPEGPTVALALLGGGVAALPFLLAHLHARKRRQ